MKYRIEYDNPGGILPNDVANRLEIMLERMVEANGNKQIMNLERKHLKKYFIEWFTNHLRVKRVKK